MTCGSAGTKRVPESLRIGELASRTGRSVHAIRWYESQGLIPGVARDGGGRRRYSDVHVSWMDLMARLRLTGMPVREMRRYAALVMQGRRTLEDRQALLSAHRERVRDTIRQWQDALRLLEVKIDFYGRWMENGVRPPLPGKRSVPVPDLRKGRSTRGAPSRSPRG
jgi:DNA-binding transcriptional MerR regulator